MRGDKGKTQLAFLAFIIFILVVVTAMLVYSAHRGL
jgi:hypothetical protein